MYGRPLDEATYDASRWIVEPFHLYDCCQENDGAAAMVLVAAERAKDFPHPPCYVLAAVSGSQHRAGTPVHNTPDYASSSFTTVAPRLYDMAELGPADVDVLQSYENFTGGVMMSIVEHGFCKPTRSTSFFTRRQLPRARGQAPAQHQRRQPGRVLHARPRAQHRGRPPDPGRVDVARCPTPTSRWLPRARW